VDHRRADPVPGTSPREAAWGALKLLPGLLLVAAGIYALVVHFPWVEARLRDLGWAAPLGFVLIYVLLAPFFFPMSLLDYACGALFGVLWGFVILVVAGSISALSMLLLGRWWLAGPIHRFVAARPRLAALRRLLAEDSRRILALLRLSPTNFALLNYLAGASGVSLRDFVLTGLILVPKVLLHLCVGVAAREMGEASRSAGGWGTMEAVGAAVSGLAVLALVALVGARARRVLERDARLLRPRPSGRPDPSGRRRDGAAPGR
jgi:uncharacterized membrane protein YdjX (TVP38/TMEM64 family)